MDPVLARRRLDYQRPDSRQTLAEALAEYYVANAGRVTPPADLPDESAALFRNHDACHVIFGLDTTLADETLVDIRTLLSCDVGIRRYTAYLRSDPQAKALFAALGWSAAVCAVVACLPRILRAVGEAARRRKRWPWTPPKAYARRTLADLRRDHGIRVF
jgi:hypothetical protein